MVLFYQLLFSDDGFMTKTFWQSLWCSLRNVSLPEILKKSALFANAFMY
jgi:hypothetical protein